MGSAPSTENRRVQAAWRKITLNRAFNATLGRSYGIEAAVETIDQRQIENLERESLLEEEEKKHKDLLFKHPEMEPIFSEIPRKSLQLKEISEKIARREGGQSQSITLLGEFLEVVSSIASLWNTWPHKEQRRLIGYQLVVRGDFGKSCSDVYKVVMNRYGPITPSNIESFGGTFLSLMIGVLRTITDECLLLAREMQEFDILEISINKVIAGTKSTLTKDVNRIWSQWIRNNFGFIYNCAKIGISRQYFDNIDTLKVIIPFLPNEYGDEYSAGTIRQDALMTLAYLVDDEDKNLIEADGDILKSVVSLFVETVKSGEMRVFDKWSSYWSVEEMTVNLTRLASNDENKRPIVKLGVLPYMVELAEKGDEEQQLDAAELFWILSFNEENKKDMGDNQKAIETLVSMAKNNNFLIRRAAKGTLWNIKNIKPEAVATSDEDTAQVETKIPHIMISYQWDVQKIVKKIRNRLKHNGYEVWLDLERMGGDTLEAMAQAVEEAAVVLVCMSSKYKDSPNCRQEAGYASDLSKKIVPLLMENGYKPNGWLGFLVGAKYYVDFTKKSFPLCIEELIKELGNDGREAIEENVEANNLPSTKSDPPSSLSVVATTDSGSNLANWTNKDVRSWLKKNEIHSEKMMKLTGKEILTLVKIKTEAPEFFYNYIKQELGITSLNEIGNLLKAIAFL